MFYIVREILSNKLARKVNIPQMCLFLSSQVICNYIRKNWKCNQI